MFTGIVEEIGVVEKIEKRESFWTLALDAGRLQDSLQSGSSLAVNGVCLTVVKKAGALVLLNAVKPTLEATNLRRLKRGSKVNLERPVGAQKSIEGHFVLGHIDTQLAIKKLLRKGDYYLLEAECPPVYQPLLIDRGSIALEGVSFTLAAVKGRTFSVNIIPYTFSATNLQYKKRGDYINVEFDYLAKIAVKYLRRLRKV